MSSWLQLERYAVGETDATETRALEDALGTDPDARALLEEIRADPVALNPAAQRDDLARLAPARRGVGEKSHGLFIQHRDERGQLVGGVRTPERPDLRSIPVASQFSLNKGSIRRSRLSDCDVRSALQPVNHGLGIGIRGKGGIPDPADAGNPGRIRRHKPGHAADERGGSAALDRKLERRQPHGAHQRQIAVTHELKGNVVPGFELALVLGSVGADSEHADAEAPEAIEEIAESAALRRAPARTRNGIPRLALEPHVGRLSWDPGAGIEKENGPARTRRRFGDVSKRELITG